MEDHRRYVLVDRDIPRFAPLQKRHLDRSSGQFHRPLRSGETPVFCSRWKTPVYLPSRGDRGIDHWVRCFVRDQVGAHRLPDTARERTFTPYSLYPVLNLHPVNPVPTHNPIQTTQSKPLHPHEKCADLIHPTCYPKNRQSEQMFRKCAKGLESIFWLQAF
jgi:hypothetical protein